MKETRFTLLSKNQDVKIIPSRITAEYDRLRSFLDIPVFFKFRMPTKKTVFDVISISAKLKIQDHKILLSERHVLTGFSIIQEEFETEVKFSFILDNNAISAIEKFRNDDVKFNIEFTILALMKTEVSFLDGKMIRNADGMSKEIANLDFPIPKSMWVEKILRDLGYQNLKLIEIPLTHKSLKEAYSDIVSEFNKAEDYFNHKDYNKCVAHCRSTLDALTRNLKKIKEGVESESSFKWLENIDKATFNWINELNKYSTGLSSKAHHAGQNRDFSRQEAESIYLVILGLLNFIAHIK